MSVKFSRAKQLTEQSYQRRGLCEFQIERTLVIMLLHYYMIQGRPQKCFKGEAKKFALILSSDFKRELDCTGLEGTELEQTIVDKNLQN